MEGFSATAGSGRAGSFVNAAGALLLTGMGVVTVLVIVGDLVYRAFFNRWDPMLVDRGEIVDGGDPS